MEVVYRGFENLCTVRLSELKEGVKKPIEFEGASSVELVFPALSITVNSEVNWLEGNGVLKFKLGELGLPTGRHKARIIAYDSQHMNGQILVHEDIHKFTILVVD